MSEKRQASWETSIDPNLLQRVTRPLRLTTMQRALANNIVGRIDRMLGHNALGTEIAQRWQTVEGMQSGTLPLAYGHRINSPESSASTGVSATSAQSSEQRPVVRPNALQRTSATSEVLPPETIVKTRTIVKPITQRIIQREMIPRDSASTSTHTETMTDTSSGQSHERAKRQSTPSDVSETQIEGDHRFVQLSRSTNPANTGYTRFIYRSTAPDSPTNIGNQNTYLGEATTPPSNSEIRSQSPANNIQRAADNPEQVRPVVKSPANWLHRKTNPLHMTLAAQHNVTVRNQTTTSKPIIQREVITRGANTPPLVIMRQTSGRNTWLSHKIQPDTMRLNTNTLSERIITRTFGKPIATPESSPAEFRLPSGTVIQHVESADQNPTRQFPETGIPTNINQVSSGSATTPLQRQSFEDNDYRQGQVQAADSPTAPSEMPFARNQSVQRQVSDYQDHPQQHIRRLSDETQHTAQMPITDNQPVQRQFSEDSDYPQGEIRPTFTESSHTPEMPLADNQAIQRQISEDTDHPQGQVRPNSSESGNLSEMPLAGNQAVQRQSSENADYPQGQIRPPFDETSSMSEMPLAGNQSLQRQSFEDVDYLQEQIRPASPDYPAQNMPIVGQNPIQRASSTESSRSHRPENTGHTNQIMPLQKRINQAQSMYSNSQSIQRAITRASIQRNIIDRETNLMLTQPIHTNIPSQGYQANPPDSLPFSQGMTMGIVSQQSSISNTLQRTPDASPMIHTNPMTNTVNRLREQISHTTQQIVQREISANQNTSQPSNPTQQTTYIQAQHQSTAPASQDNAPQESEIDIDTLVEKVWRRIVRRLGIERERRGGRKWF